MNYDNTIQNMYDLLEALVDEVNIHSESLDVTMDLNKQFIEYLENVESRLEIMENNQTQIINLLFGPPDTTPPEDDKPKKKNHLKLVH